MFVYFIYFFPQPHGPVVLKSFSIEMEAIKYNKKAYPRIMQLVVTCTAKLLLRDFEGL